MKIQSAGRLGNTLFIWAYANFLSKEKNTRVSIFTDRFHSIVGFEAEETKKLLSEPRIRFYNSDLLGLLLVFIDRVSSKSAKLGNVLKKLFRIADENEPITRRTQIIRGYFQKSDYTLKNIALIREKLLHATHSVERSSEKVSQILMTYPQYQVVHIRLGDYIDSEFGVISPESYKQDLDPVFPILICTDGSREEVLRLINFSVKEIFTPADLNTWETLSVMQGASRFIGVNSTLSWWGAFLAIAKGNLAFLPDQWNKSGNAYNYLSLNLEGSKSYKANFI